MKRKPRIPQAPRVVIVGGGIMGCAAALELGQAGVTVTVLERSVPGAEASSAAAGILGADVEAHEPGPLSELCVASRALYPALVRRIEKVSGIATDYRKCGVIKVARGAAELSRIQAQHRWQLRQRPGVRALPARELSRREPALAAKLAGVAFDADATLDPKALLAALRIAAERAGAKFRTGALVRRVAVVEGRATGVELDDGSAIAGSHVVLAAGSWTSSLTAESGALRVVPARGQIVELKTPVPLLRSIVFGADCYLVPRSDGRLLIGSTVEFVGFQRGVTAGAVARLLHAAIGLVPALAEAELSATWSSFRPYTSDELPLLGPSRTPGLLYMSGHYRNGILLAPISAAIIKACVLGRKPPVAIAPFAPER